MGVLTDFFIANDVELNAACRGWKRPAPLLDEFRTVTATNPFTRQPMQIRTRLNPDQPKADADAVTNCDYRHLPWIAQKGILWSELALLACVLLPWDRENAEQEITGRSLKGPPCEEVVIEFIRHCCRDWRNYLWTNVQDTAPNGPDSIARMQ